MQIATQESIHLLTNTDAQLGGSERRKFRAGVVRTLGRGGQCYVEKIFNWGRKAAEHHLPNLLLDIKEIIEPRSQTDPTFRSTRIYTRLTAQTVRTRLLEDFDYKDSSLPRVRILRNKMVTTQVGF